MRVLLHNPKCSKSRKAKDILDSNNIEYDLRLYLEHPLAKSELNDLLGKIDTESMSLLRTKEQEYQDLGLSSPSKEQIIEAIVAHPKILERPIFIEEQRALIARPPELLVEWLK